MNSKLLFFSCILILILNTLCQADSPCMPNMPASEKWTQGEYGSHFINALNHWKKHGAEFPELNSFESYLCAAYHFTHQPIPGTLQSIAANGDHLFYNPNTNTFAATNEKGVPRTFFKPSEKINYWYKQ